MSDSIIDWQNKCCTKCRKPLVFEKHVHTRAYDGWRLDCKCWDSPAPLPVTND